MIDGWSVFIGIVIGSFVTAIIIDWTDEDVEDKAEIFDRLFDDGIINKNDARRYMQQLRDLYSKK